MEKIFARTSENSNPLSYKVKFRNEYPTPPLVTIDCNPNVKITKLETFTDRAIVSFDPKPKTFVCLIKGRRTMPNNKEIFEVEKSFTFSYTHRLHKLENGHQCCNFHGHNSKLTFIIEAEKLDPYGFVTDFGNLKIILKQWIKYNWDHSVICSSEDEKLLQAIEILETKHYILKHSNHATSENLCKEIYKETIKSILALLDKEKINLLSVIVKFQESETSCATYKRVYKGLCSC